MKNKLAELKVDYPNIRVDGLRYWQIPSIEDGLRYFYAENRRYPNPTEFDNFEYLPRWKVILKRFGSLEKLLGILNLPTPTKTKRVSTKHQTNRARTAKGVYPDLLRQEGKRLQWDLANIRDGFEIFYEQHGRQPTAFEVDDSEFLPSSRLIQRSYGGLIALRKLLGHDVTSFSRGKERSGTSKMISQRGRKWELKLESELVKVFGEMFVHVEKDLVKVVIG